MDKLQAYNTFWKSFGIPAYDGLSVPEKVYDEASQKMIPLEPPYITYNAVYDSFGASFPTTASLWYRETGWTDVSRKAEEIANAITRGGKMVGYDGGAFWIRRGTPWAQRMTDPNDDSIRRILLNLEIEFMD